jgi:hypothetical protein
MEKKTFPTLGGGRVTRWVFYVEKQKIILQTSFKVAFTGNRQLPRGSMPLVDLQITAGVCLLKRLFDIPREPLTIKCSLPVLQAVKIQIKVRPIQQSSFKTIQHFLIPNQKRQLAKISSQWEIPLLFINDEPYHLYCLKNTSSQQRGELPALEENSVNSSVCYRTRTSSRSMTDSPTKRPVKQKRRDSFPPISHSLLK